MFRFLNIMFRFLMLCSGYSILCRLLIFMFRFQTLCSGFKYNAQVYKIVFRSPTLCSNELRDFFQVCLLDPYGGRGGYTWDNITFRFQFLKIFKSFLFKQKILRFCSIYLICLYYPTLRKNFIKYFLNVFSSWIEENCWQQSVKEHIGSLVRAVLGVEPGQVSLLFLLLVAGSSGGVISLFFSHKVLVEGGTGGIISRLGIYLNSYSFYFIC